MPIIDTSNPNKFDKVIRTNKGETLLSLIFATYRVPEDVDDRKSLIAENLKSAMEVLRSSGAGSYGVDGDKVSKRFSSYYTMGSEMGIWADDDLNLSPLALQVAEQDISVKTYIGIIFLNLFTYFENENGKLVYTHFLYNLLNHLVTSNLMGSEDIPKEIIKNIFAMNNEQVNLLIEYLIDTHYFNRSDSGITATNWCRNNVRKIIKQCNLEYNDSNPEETQQIFKSRSYYSLYVTKEFKDENLEGKNIDPDEDYYDFKQGFIDYMSNNNIGHIQYVGQLIKAVERWNEENPTELLEDIYVYPQPILNRTFFHRWEETLKLIYDRNEGGFDLNKHITAMKRYRVYISTLNLNELSSTNTKKASDATLVDTGINRIYFGAPGTGKSYGIKKFIRENGIPDYDDKMDHPNVFRTSLHPEFGYSDFIGQVMPVVKKTDVIEEASITYEFTPQVFTKALKRAFEYEVINQEPVFLVLEEMSRSNVAAVFGDLFQLLDRDENGESEYRIDNSLISSHIFGKYTTNKIYIPKNFYILGTVNTSDQNVYVMDTAFKRRFEFNYLETSELAKDSKGNYLNDYKFILKNSLGQNIELTWIMLLQELNSFITTEEEKGGLGLPEDKQLGQFFIKFKDANPDLTDEEIQKIEIYNYNQITGKLLQYLWSDVQEASYSNNRLFSEDVRNFGEIYRRAKLHMNFFSQNFIQKFDVKIIKVDSEEQETDVERLDEED